MGMSTHLRTYAHRSWLGGIVFSHFGALTRHATLGIDWPMQTAAKEEDPGTVELTSHPDHVRELICELSRHFYGLGWVSGTGGGISVRQADRIFMAPSGVQKERLCPGDLFVLNMDGMVIEQPGRGLKLSQCHPLFMHAYTLRHAGAVVHSHSLNAVLATTLHPTMFRVRNMEMQKGIDGYGAFDTLEVPIIENTAHECDLTDSLAQAIEAHPKAHAVLVRRHGVYVWGKDWVRAKTHAECYDYLFGAVVKMRALGVDPMG
jgi:methylthioribulose-1-phosphate dehydratase